MAKNEQAAAVALSLQGRARKAAMELSLEELNCDDGLIVPFPIISTLFKSS